MIQNLYMGNGCLTKHPLKTGCLEFQVYVFFPQLFAQKFWTWCLEKLLSRMLVISQDEKEHRYRENTVDGSGYLGYVDSNQG